MRATKWVYIPAGKKTRNNMVESIVLTRAGKYR
jgi:hypothetical protein